jgi:hypothetical protein
MEEIKQMIAWGTPSGSLIATIPRRVGGGFGLVGAERSGGGGQAGILTISILKHVRRVVWSLAGMR